MCREAERLPTNSRYSSSGRLIVASFRVGHTCPEADPAEKVGNEFSILGAGEA